MIEGLLSLLGTASDGLGLFSGITSLIRGKQTREHLNRIEASLTGISLHVERLADRILYVTNMPAVRDLAKSRQDCVGDLTQTRHFLQPVQQSLGDDLLASSIIATPPKLARAIGNDPFDLLMDTRPIHRATYHPNMVPLMFQDGGQLYLGWQSRNGLENMFDVQCDDLWLPSADRYALESRPQTNYERTQRSQESNPARFICPGCGDRATGADGKLCRRCDAFVHDECLSKGKRVSGSFGDWMVGTTTWNAVCPMCGSVLGRFQEIETINGYVTRLDDSGH
ncbi:MAG: hypothetical protein U9N38_00460 [Thermodesulfobacteriota bacterium]|nr:hypothetical protein [Thermodesulfobacteriota bacterium]